MTALPLTVERIAELLGGDVAGAGAEVLCPGPGHSADDRSLSVKPDPASREGFLVHSFAGDDWRVCRDHVSKLLRLPEPQQQQQKKANGGGTVWTTLGEYIYRDENGEPFLKVRKCLDEKGKKQFPQYHWNGNGWAKGKPDGAKIPYRLPELIAPKTALVYFCEGEKDADTLAKIGFVATTMSEGASAKWDAALTPYFKDRHVVILPDADRPGREHAQKVAKAIHGVAAEVRVVDLFPDRHDGSDVSDWIAGDTAGVRLAKEVKAADEWEPSGSATSAGAASSYAEPPEPGDESATAIKISRLAALPAIKYEQERKAAAKALGFRALILDRLVKDERARLGLDGGADAGMQGRAISFPEPQPWPEEVDGAALLDEISKAIGSHVIMPEASRDACALWCAHTFLLDCSMISPRLAITSPTRGCGKTTMLDVIAPLVSRPLSAANVTPSTIFRVVEKHRPTILVDETDTFLGGSDELRGILNSGHRKSGAVLRTVGDDHEPRAFSTYGACAIAQIGQLPGTLADRSVPVTLTRRKRDENITPFRLDKVDHLVVLARKLARWTADNAVAIAATEPTMPGGLYNRAADNWRPLMAIATVAGGDWPERGQEAALAGIAADIDEASRLELVLGDIRAIFTSQGVERISSTLLAKSLADMEGRPWAEYGRTEKPITPGKLARLLKPVAIVPENIRVVVHIDGKDEEKVLKGYVLERFKEAFARYLGLEGVSDPLQRYNADETGTSDLFQTATAQPDVADRKCEKANNDGLCSGVADRKGRQGEAHEVCAHCGRPGGSEVSVSGRTARLHRDCEDPYWRFLDEGHGEGSPADKGRPAASPPSRVPGFRVKGSAEPDAVCVWCHLDNGEVKRIGGPEAGSTSETLHEKCAAQWFAGLRNFDTDDDDRADRMSGN